MPQRTPSEERERQERKERERAQAARDGAPSPRKTKQTTSKSKPPMPNPPRIIVDDQGLEFKRGELLGQVSLLERERWGVWVAVEGGRDGCSLNKGASP